MKEFEIVKCECGHEAPIEFAHIDEEGNWTCINCILDEIYNKKANGINSENSNCNIFDIMPLLRNVHKMLEVDFDEQDDVNKELMSDIVEMCQNIADDYWMYKRE